MKKFLKITGITLLSIFLLLLLLPFLFQGKIIKLVKNEANEMLNAKVDFRKVSLSFIRNFPNASVTIDDFYIVGIDEFANDTLASFDKLAVTVNIKSFFGDQWEINKIRLSNPKVLAKVLPDGKVNWDIMKPSEETEEEPADTTSTGGMNLKLEKLTIENGYIVYDDQEGKMKAILDNLNFTLSGDMAQEITTLNILTDIEKINFLMDDIHYLTDAKFDAKIDMNADLKNYKFTFSNNELNLNKIKLNFEGWLTMLDEGYDMDIKLNTPNIEFKDLLSMIPALYAKDFESIQTKGKLKLDAAAKGIYKDSTQYPAFDIKMLVSDAYFKYPDLPKSIDNINIDAQVSNPGGDFDLTVVNIPKFHFEMAQNPFDMHLKIANPDSDMSFDFGAKGTLNLNSLKEVYPLEAGTNIAGIIKADLEVAGRMSQIEKEQYESIKAHGDLALSGFTYKSADMPPVLINNASMNFTPRYVNLTNFDIKIANSDIQATGRLENFIAYALKDQTIKGELNVNSTLLNVNDFMGKEETPAPAGNQAATPAAQPTAEEAASTIEVPKNIDFRINANLKKVTYDAIVLENIKGTIKAANGILTIDNANMNAFGGQMHMNGFYSTENIEDPNVNMKLNIKDVLYTEIFKQTEMVKQFAPIFENMTGKFSTDIQFSSKLDNEMSPIYPSVTGNGVLTSKDISVSNVKALDALADALKNDKLKKLDVKDIKIKFEILNGRINTEPFNIKMGTTNMDVSGSTGLDQTIDYTGKVTMPYDLKGIPVTTKLKIGGTFTKPTIKLDMSDMTNAIKDAAIQEVKNIVNENIQKLIEEAKKQKDNIVTAAEKQAANIRSEAAKISNNIVSEAEKQGQKLISEANKTSNPIAKVAAVKAAEASAKKMKEEAQKKADDLNKTADDQANKLVNSAKDQGDKLIKTAEDKGKI